jgi:hypothetical protein
MHDLVWQFDPRRSRGLTGAWFVEADWEAGRKVVGEFGEEVLGRDECEFGAGVGDLVSDLLAGEGNVDRDVHGAGEMEGEVGDDPLKSVFGDVGDGVTWGDSGEA